jgi:hypothetical protein
MASQRTVTDLLRWLANESRTIVADWRVHLIHAALARRAGKRVPLGPDTRSLIRRMLSDSLLAGIPGAVGVFRVTAPFASILRAPEEAVAIEASPLAALSLRTALFVHGLIQQHPEEISCTSFPNSTGRLPLGTTPEDWIDCQVPKGRTPRKIYARPVLWMRSKPELDFGIMIGFVDGVATYVTDLPRTLIDTLRYPEQCGGILEVFRSWRAARDGVDVGQLTIYVDRIGQTVLRQRVGWILDELGLEFPLRAQWLKLAKRGSSARLVASSPFAATYSAAWSISLNVPQDAIGELQS